MVNFELKKRLLKQKQKRLAEYKKIFNYLIDNTELKQYKNIIKFRISDKVFYRQRTYAKYFTNRENQKTWKVIIKFDLKLLKRLYLEGFTSDYYCCRGFLLNSILKGNKKLTIRFIMLHELKHALDKIKGLGLNYFKSKNNICELNADKFAYNHLRYLGYIKK